jgi:hypothetical protein
VVTRRSLSTCQIADIVTTEVLEEVNCYLELSKSLSVTLGACSLNTVNEEVPNFLILHLFYNLSADFAKHQISLLVLEGIVKARLRAGLKIFNKWLNLFNSCIGLSEHHLTSQRVNDFFLCFSCLPLPLDQVVSL